MRTRTTMPALSLVLSLLVGLWPSPGEAAKSSPAPRASASAQSATANDVLRIAVLEFKAYNVQDGDKDAGRAITEKLEIAFTKNGHYQVIERGEIDKLIKEVSFSQTGLVDPKSAIKVGKLLQARYVVAGSLTRQGPILNVNARLIDVQTGAIASADNVEFPSLPPMMDKAIEHLVEKLRAGMTK